MRYIPSVAALAIVSGMVAASAQTAPSTPAPRAAAPVTGQILVQDANTILGKELVGSAVFDSEQMNIGSITDLILSKDGKNVEGFVVGVGGFLGIGAKNVALKMDRLKINQSPEKGLRFVVDIKKDELSSAPSFKSRQEQDAEQAAERARQQSPTAPAQKK